MKIEDKLIFQNLEKEIPILTAQIRALYRELDQKFRLHGANIPITFGYEKDLLGSFTPATAHEKAHFHFSLLFVGYGVEHPLQKSDRMDLYKHEYAHYMQYNMEIPKKYQWQNGIHGSAWKYCCSLVGAAPTPYYKVGESLLKHDYEKALKNPIHDSTVTIRDQYRREQEYRTKKNTEIRYQIEDVVEHPKFGSGIIEKIEPMAGAVNLYVRFGETIRVIDQGWLWRMQHQKH